MLVISDINQPKEAADYNIHDVRSSVANAETVAMTTVLFTTSPFRCRDGSICRNYSDSIGNSVLYRIGVFNIGFYPYIVYVLVTNK